MNITLGLNEGGKLKQTISIQLSQAPQSDPETSALKSMLAQKLRQEASVPKDRTGTPFTRNTIEPSAG